LFPLVTQTVLEFTMVMIIY